jgi:DNA-binding LacI/PurR family transcriptional regulator
VTRTGARAVQMLHRLVDGEVTPPASEILPVELVIRESCGAALAAGRRASA